MISIQPIDDRSPHLQAVVSLGHGHRDTLGFLPVGAFEAYARERHILVALVNGQRRRIRRAWFRAEYQRVTKLFDFLESKGRWRRKIGALDR